MSRGELIELQELTLDDRIELTAQPPPRTPRLERVNALRISPGKVPELLSRVRIIRLLGDSLDPRLTDETGEGHDFQPCTHTQPTWCDLCGDFIWGLYKQSLRCASCRFTCHYRCRALIQLDCSSARTSFIDQSDAVEDTIETDTNVGTASVPWVAVSGPQVPEGAGTGPTASPRPAGRGVSAL
ncbi:hypothetical protein AAFF_G00042250 [Aldrovandia affinis]|uniref:Phorbol-ester/DAG-type domain-containing protein n=1 Tax=Aldrovandia affinis TaxID=143900 RepID=A0AAD7S2L8_9TELE|nr:hypothetical protein AAFF_G00042250 [Aldrovandia affinis]